MRSEMKDIGRRLQGMRDILDLSPGQMAEATGVSADEYLAVEKGEKDFSFTFLYRAADRLGIDLTELISGESPHRTGYTVVRKGQGMPINRRQGFSYLNLAAHFRNRQAEPFLVTAPYEDGAEDREPALNTHEGQEMDYILSGSLKIKIDQNTEVLSQGDSIYYDSGHPHGMLAIDGSECRFLAIVIKK